MWGLNKGLDANGVNNTGAKQGGIGGLKEEIRSAASILSQTSEIVEAPKKIWNLRKPPEIFWINIITETRPFSDTVPECAESTVDPDVWFYNYSAIDKLVKMWVVRLPSKEQLLAYINIFQGNNIEKAQGMNGEDEPLPGFRGADSGGVCYRGSDVFWWVILPDRSISYVRWGRNNSQETDLIFYDHKVGFLVPEFFE